MPALDAMQCILPSLLCTAVQGSCNQVSMYFSDAEVPHLPALDTTKLGMIVSTFLAAYTTNVSPRHPLLHPFIFHLQHPVTPCAHPIPRRHPTTPACSRYSHPHHCLDQWSGGKSAPSTPLSALLVSDTLLVSADKGASSHVSAAGA